MPRHSTLRFCDAREFRRVLEGACLVDVAVRGHATEHYIEDMETLWQGGLGSLAMTSAAIIRQPVEMRARIRRPSRSELPVIVPRGASSSRRRF